MASNNNTEVVNGVVQPRFYQVYGDLIESKEIMEPLAIGVGTGPICGFDWVDTSKTSVTITSIFKSNSGAKGLPMLKGKSRRVFLSDKDNNAGRVFNAYTTPDGLCHIAPDTLTFNGMQPEGGWPSTTNPTKLVAFVVKASHTYKPNNSENTPSLANFTCNWLTLDSKTYLSTILQWNYEEVLQAISKSGISFDPNTETIIGIYLVGWNTSWNEDTESVRLKALISDFNYILCLVPAGGKYPVAPFGLHPLDILDLKNRVKSVETLIPSVTSISSILNNQVVTFGRGIEIEYSYESSEITVTGLKIYGCIFETPKSVVLKVVAGDAGRGIACAYTLEQIKTMTTVPYDEWTVVRGIVSTPNGGNWGGNIVWVGVPGGYNVVGVFDLRHGSNLDYKISSRRVFPNYAAAEPNITNDPIAKLAMALSIMFENMTYGLGYNWNWAVEEAALNKSISNIAISGMFNYFSLGFRVQITLAGVSPNPTSSSLDINLLDYPDISEEQKYALSEMHNYLDNTDYMQVGFWRGKLFFSSTTKIVSTTDSEYSIELGLLFSSTKPMLRIKVDKISGNWPSQGETAMHTFWFSMPIKAPLNNWYNILGNLQADKS